MKAKVAVLLPLFLFVCSTSFAAIWAGTPIVDLNGSTIAAASGERLATWTNSVVGSPVGNFITVTGTTSPFVEDYTSPVNSVVTKVLAFDWNDGAGNCLTSQNNTPVSITGAGDWSVEVWALNSSIEGEETLVAWARRDGPCLTNASFNYGNNGTWGAFGGWCDTGDMGFDLGVPLAGAWHHIVWTYDGATQLLYTDGKLNAQEAKTLALHPAFKIRVGGQSWIGGPLPWLQGKIAIVRVHDGVLGEGEVIANFEAERDDFGYQEIGAVTVDPSLIDFGQVAGGTGPSAPVLVTVGNDPMASGDLMFTEDIIILGPFELADPLPVYGALIPGATMQFGIAFDPVDDNPACGLVIIRTSDPDGDAHIALYGNQLSGYVTLMEDNFDAAHNYKTNGVTGTDFDGIVGAVGTHTVFNTTAYPGLLTITGTNAGWADAGQGLLLYKDVTGDFVAELEIRDATWANYIAPGLYCRVANLDDAGPGEDWVGVNYFPAWNNSNFFEDNDDGVRTERNGGYGEANAKKFIRIARIGDIFHCSVKGNVGDPWTPMEESPWTRSDMNGLPLQVGVAFSMFGGTGTATYNSFKITTPPECILESTPTPLPPAPTATPTELPPPSTGVEEWSVFK